MALNLNPNIPFTFTGYTVEDDGTHMTFVASTPGPGQRSEYTILLADDELAAVSTQQQLRDLVTTKLQRKIRASGIASKLDGFIGQSITL